MEHLRRLSRLPRFPGEYISLMHNYLLEVASITYVICHVIRIALLTQASETIEAYSNITKVEQRKLNYYNISRIYRF